MVREFLGNLMGPQGEQGPKGEQGPQGDDGNPQLFLEENPIDTRNMLNLSVLRGLSDTGEIDVNVESGLVEYTGVQWFMNMHIHLDNKIYYFKIQDYEINPGYSFGNLRISVYDQSGDTVLSSTVVLKKNLYEIDLTDRDANELYDFRFQVDNNDGVPGYLLQPTLTLTPHTAVWTPSLTDVYSDIASTRNLIPYTSFKVGSYEIGQWSPWNSDIWPYAQVDKYMLFRNIDTNQTGSGTIGVISPAFTEIVHAGRKYTIRFLGLGNAMNELFDHCHLINVDGEPRADGGSGDMEIPVTKITHNYEIRSNGSYANLYEITFVSQWTGRASLMVGSTVDLGSNGNHWISEPMLVVGNRAPKDWTPAPEDAGEKIKELQQKIDELLD